MTINQIKSKLTELTGHNHIAITTRGNVAIKTVLALVNKRLLIPEEGVEAGDFKERFQMVGDDFVKAFNRPHPKSGLIIGGGLVILGSVWLLEALGIPWLWWFDFDYLWPAVLILAGVVMIIRWRQ